MKSKRLKVSKNTCPLENQSIDIVPENNHLVGLCLCQFCKCGKHICTKNRHLNAQYLSDSFNTSYSRDYKPSRFDVPYIVNPHPYRPNNQKMDFVTTNSVQYKSPTPIDTNLQQEPKTPKARNILIGTTTNSYYFPNWGKNEINYEKGWHPPVRSVEIPFRGETSYSRQFIKPDMEKSKNADPRKFSACQSKISITPKDSFNPRTTYKEKMHDYSKTNLNTHIKVLTPKAKVTRATPNHFRTSSDRFYSTRKTTNIDPRSMRLALLSRGSIG